MTFVRYVAVQLVAYVIDLGVFIALFHAGVAGPIVANVVAKIAAGAFAFAAHRGFTFGVAGMHRIGREALAYGALLALNVPVASGLLALLLLAIENATLAKIVSDVICVGLTFVLTKHGVFRAGARDTKRIAADR